MSNKYEAVIGLEIHAQLKTKSKMFCGCDNFSVDVAPNKNICPICMGMPGILPKANQQAIEWTYLLGMALGARIPETFNFERKNYFYPDLPKAYQITSQNKPPVVGGYLEINVADDSKKIRINHIHLEEDAGKLIHPKNNGCSFVDLNRAGTPLLEIVTEPDLRSPNEARVFMQDLRAILRYLGVSDANMEQGNLRCDANISLRLVGQKELGVKVEIKNINSFKMVEKALEFEVERQTEILTEGKKIVQETRGWDDAKGITQSQRNKEEANDYRYFPEPDLPSFSPHDDDGEKLKEIKNQLPELPKEKRTRFEQEYALSINDAETLTSDLELARYFEQTMEELPEIAENSELKKEKAKKVANWIISELLARLNSKNVNITDNKIKPKDFAALLEKIESGDISGKIAKDVFDEMFIGGRSPESVIKEKGLVQINDERKLESIVSKVLKENPGPVADLLQGKEKAFGFLIGQTMAATEGQANPKIINSLIREKINSLKK